MTKRKILIVDDEKPTRDAMARALGRTYDCLTAADAELALKEVAAHPDLALVITDYKMPGDNGIELIRKAKAANPSLGAILVTAFGEIELAVTAMKEGADDFLAKPITDLDQLEFRVAQAIREPAGSEKPKANGEKRGASASSDPSSAAGRPPPDGFQDFTGSSPAMEKVYRLIRKVAPTNATVLVEGPSGTGKELVARALHALSPRAKSPFVAVECAALSKELLESELFGYAPGTFTGGLKDGKEGCFEAARGGTLFLDEIGEIDADTQVKLLRVLESRTVKRLGSPLSVPVDFRLVTATNRNLLKEVADGRFREDLYYRLNVIDIRTPALKDHREDIAPLVARFLGEFSKANGGTVTGIDAAALKRLADYAWPGNVRQLRNAVERMVVLASGATLTVEDLPEEIATGETAGSRDAGTGDAGGAGRATEEKTTCGTPAASLADSERTQILAALERCRGNKSRAADELGISRRTILRKLKEWGLE